MLETSFLILSLAFLLMALFSIPIFWQLWQTAKKMTAAMETLNKSLPGILKNLEGITCNLSSASEVIRREVEVLAALGRNIRAVLEMAKGVEGLVREGVRKLPITEKIKTARSLWKGFRVFLDVLQEKRECQPGDRK